MTEAVYTVTAEYIVEMEQRPVKHRVSVSGVLKHRGVSRSGFNAWKKRCPSVTEKLRGKIKEKIRKIYEEFHQNYGAPKIPRKIIAWVLSEKLEASHVVECIEKAKKNLRITHPLIIHTDRGCQYVSDVFRKATAGIVNSYSKKAYPWDNVCIESFHALLKREWINRFKIFNYRYAYKLVFEYIETFYNTVRIHSHCVYLSPDQYDEEEYHATLDKRAEALAG